MLSLTALEITSRRLCVPGRILGPLNIIGANPFLEKMRSAKLSAYRMITIIAARYSKRSCRRYSFFCRTYSNIHQLHIVKEGNCLQMLLRIISSSSEYGQGSLGF